MVNGINGGNSINGIAGDMNIKINVPNDTDDKHDDEVFPKPPRPAIVKVITKESAQEWKKRVLDEAVERAQSERLKDGIGNNNVKNETKEESDEKVNVLDINACRWDRNG